MEESWKAVLDPLNTPLWDPRFPKELFAALSQRLSPSTPIESLIAEPYIDLSREIDRSGIQDSSVVRTTLLVRSLVKLLIDDEGEIQGDLVRLAFDGLRSRLYSLGPARARDGLFRLHLLRVLRSLEDPALCQIIERAAPPSDQRQADYLIRATLQLSPTATVNAAAARRAILAAWMTPLRQSVGSCFATAPAIMIQGEQPAHLLKDLVQLLSLGRITRIVQGVEQSVPLGKSWGLGELRRPQPLALLRERGAHSPALQRAFVAAGLIDGELSPSSMRAELHQFIHRLDLPEMTDCNELLQKALALRYLPESQRYQEALEGSRDAFKAMADCALLKAWEFSLASLVDLRADLNRWNLYNCLGIRHEEEGGVGRVAHRVIEERLIDVNRDLQLLDESYDRAKLTLQAANNRVKEASAQEAQWLRVDAGRRLTEVERIGEERQAVEQRGQLLTHLFVAFMNRLLELMRDSFQEVYDAEMQEVRVGPFDDTPAGFRLVYKHGRNNPALWSWIRSPKEFVEALADFFARSEVGLLPDAQWHLIQRDISAIVSQIILHIRSPGFVEGTLRRMATLYGKRLIADPMDHLDQVEMKPWGYLSGGSMSHLLRHYYGREGEISLRGRWVDSPFDLCVMLLDLLKELPPRTTDPFLKNPTRSMLIHSPTHAFVAKPGLTPFAEGWQDPGNSYTWARDKILLPQREFLQSIQLGEGERGWLIDRLFPGGERSRLKKKVAQAKGTVEFRNALLKEVGRGFEEAVDGLLFSSLPLHPLHLVEKRMAELFGLLVKRERASELARLVHELRPTLAPAGFLSALELQELAQAVWMVYTESTAVNQDIAFALRRAMRQCGYAYPTPYLFADSNWAHDYFAFVVNPGSGEFDLWRVDYLGLEGVPMVSWRGWLNGSSRESWELYIDPREYGQWS